MRNWMAGTAVTGLLILGLLAALVAPSRAHQQFMFEAKAGEYTARLFVFADGLYADEVLPFDVDLVDANDDQVPFSDVAVRIMAIGRGGQFSTLVHLSEGDGFMNYTFPRAGKYEVALGFVQDGNMFTQAAFPLEIVAFSDAGSNAPGAIQMLPWTWITLALLLAFVLGFGTRHAWAVMAARRRG
jgi:hypothetical protein